MDACRLVPVLFFNRPLPGSFGHSVYPRMQVVCQTT
jgi:hypothetical protein